MSTTTRSAKRTEFLNDLLVTTIENGGYGPFRTLSYEPRDAEPYAVVRFHGDGMASHRVTVETFAHGISVIRKAVDQINSDYPSDGEVLHNAGTGQRLFMGSEMRQRILMASDENDAGEMDVLDALAILECAIFGAVTYC